MKNLPSLACHKKSRLFEKTNKKSYMNHIQLHIVYGVKCVKLTCEHFSVTGGWKHNQRFDQETNKVQDVLMKDVPLL